VSASGPDRSATQPSRRPIHLAEVQARPNWERVLWLGGGEGETRTRSRRCEPTRARQAALEPGTFQTNCRTRDPSAALSSFLPSPTTVWPSSPLSNSPPMHPDANAIHLQPPTRTPVLSGRANLDDLASTETGQSAAAADERSRKAGGRAASSRGGWSSVTHAAGTRLERANAAARPGPVCGDVDG